MQKISAYILCFNEAAKIRAAVESVLWADEVVAVDSNSTDGTAEIAASLGARVVQVPFNGFGDLRNRAVDACRCDWIFSLDADERCTKAVRDEILSLLAGQPPHDAYRVPRRNYMMGRWIRGSGWYPNFRQPQLFRKGSMRYTLEPVHEGYEVLGGKSVGTLRNAIWQYPFRNLSEVLKKADRYSSLGVPKLAGKRVSMSERIRPRTVGLPETLYFQAWFHRRLGRLRYRFWEFRGHLLPLRQDLRTGAELGAAGERAFDAGSSFKTSVIVGFVARRAGKRRSTRLRADVNAGLLRRLARNDAVCLKTAAAPRRAAACRARQNRRKNSAAARWPAFCRSRSAGPFC